MNLSIIILLLQSSRAIHNRQRSRNGLRPPLTSANFPVYVGTRERKQRVLSPAKIVIFSYTFLYHFILPQKIRAPFERQSIKNLCGFKCHNKQKKQYFQWFSQCFLALKNKYYFSKNKNTPGPTCPGVLVCYLSHIIRIGLK